MSLLSESSRGADRELISAASDRETLLGRSGLQESAAPTGVLVTDAHERVLHAEGAAFPQHGLSVVGWRGRPIEELLPAAATAVLMPRYRAALAGTPQSFDYRTSDGSRTYRVQIAPLRDEAGAVTSVVAVLQDTTERRLMNADLSRSENRLREAERMVGLGSWELILASGEITSSPGLTRLLDLDDDRPLDLETFMGRIHPDDRSAVKRAAAACRKSGSVVVEYRVIWRDGSERILSTRAELVARPGEESDQMRGAVLDVTDQREAERARLAAEHLFQQGFDAAPIGMTLSDAGDGRSFRVNEALCRLVGRPADQLIGESVLTVIHPDDRGAVADARAEMVAGRRSTFEAEVRYLRPDGGAAWGLLHVAPVRREDGSVSVFHSQVIDITERKEREARLTNDVGDAIWLGRIRAALDDGRFVLYSQPIIDLVSGRAVQHELLLRMQSEDGSVIAPCEFLPVAERYGLISEIDRWVIREAVQIAATGGPTEFNLSARSVGDPSMIRELATAIKQTGADPALIVVEVTETALLGRTEVGREFAQQVRALGCQVALDDFGTGFSSLSYLKHLPADYLKIDIEFIRELSSSETDARVVRGIVGLAREFGQITVAEGVEDEGTLVRLKELGVDRAQGYLFARPAPRSSCAASGPASTQRASELGGDADPVATVRAAFDAFAASDVPAMLRHCRPDIVLRSFATSQLAKRGAPYRGHDGVRSYLQDVASLYEELRFTPLELRQTQDSVIGFGQVEALGANAMSASVLWIVQLQAGQLSSIEVFQAPEHDAADQAARDWSAAAIRT